MNYRRLLVRICTFLGGLYFLLKWLLPAEMQLGSSSIRFSDFNDQIVTGLQVVGVMALGLGLINLLIGHGSTIIYRRVGAINSAALLAGMAAMFIISWMDWNGSEQVARVARESSMLREFAQRIVSDHAQARPGVLPWQLRNKLLVDESLNLALRLEEQSRQIAADSEVAAHPLHGAAQREFGEALANVRQTAAVVAVSTEASPEQLTENHKISAALGELASASQQLFALRYERSARRKVYGVFFDGLFVPLGAAMFSLLGFYIASAAYRAFRVRSFESALMMGAALLVIFGQIPFRLFGSSETAQSLYLLLPDIRLWLLSVPNSAAFRAISIGAGVASLVLAFRMLFSIESESFTQRKR